MADAQTLDERIAEAKARGTRAGHNAGTWIIDGNTTDDTCRAILALIDGDSSNDGLLVTPDWLSGQWAGESITELLGDLLEEDTDDESGAWEDITDAYCEAADAAFWSEVERSVRARLDGAQ